MKNRYSKGAHISEARFREVIRFFAADLPTLTAAELTGLNYRTVDRIYSLMRECLVELTLQEKNPSPETLRWMRATLEPAESGVKEGVDQEARPSERSC